MRGMLQALDASPYLSVQRAASMHDAAGGARRAAQVRGILVVREDFTAAPGALRRLAGHGALDRQRHRPEHRAHPGRLCQRRAADLAGRPGDASGALPSPAASTLQYRDWFNPELRSADSIVPGVIAMVMTMTGTLLTALIVAREWERGTMESMLASPGAHGRADPGQARLLFRAGHGQHGDVGADGDRAVRRAVPRRPARAGGRRRRCSWCSRWRSGCSSRRWRATSSSRRSWRS